MKKIAFGKVGIAVGIAAILLLGIITATAPSANKERVQTEYLTSRSAQTWIDRSVYQNGWRAQLVKHNGQAVDGSFVFAKGDNLTVEVPKELTGSHKIGISYHAETAEPSDVLLTVVYGEANYTAYLPLVCSIKSDAHIRSNNTNKPSLTPYNTYYRMINTLDGSSFGSAGQKVMWEFEVEAEGWYELGVNFCQNSAVNKKVYREIEIDGILPFAELSLVPFPQTKNLAYETMFLSDEAGEAYQIYLEKGRHTIAMTAQLGDAKAIYEELKSLVTDMNALGIARFRYGSAHCWDRDSNPRCLFWCSNRYSTVIRFL